MAFLSKKKSSSTPASTSTPANTPASTPDTTQQPCTGLVTCGTCSGTGRDIGIRCTVCKGVGSVRL